MWHFLQATEACKVIIQFITVVPPDPTSSVLIRRISMLKLKESHTVHGPPKSGHKSEQFVPTQAGQTQNTFLLTIIQIHLRMFAN